MRTLARRTFARRLCSAHDVSAASTPPLPPPKLPPRRLSGNGPLVSPVGLGCMALSQAGGPSQEQAAAVIHAALDAGITFFDTADVYCTSDEDIGHNERLLRRAFDSYGGDTSGVVVATKGIMSRPGGDWVAGSDPDALFAACDRSLEALGVDCLDLYYLHTPSGFDGDDFKFAKACANLRNLQQEGKIRHVGLSNVSYEQLVSSQAAIEVAACQNRCNLFDPSAFHDGVVGHCKQTGVAFVPYSPMGGPRGPGSHIDSTARDGLGLQPLCQKLGCSAHELMLSWLLQIDDCIIPIAGATRMESVTSIARAAKDKFPLADEDIAQFLR